jgi:hypothetical protein
MRCPKGHLLPNKTNRGSCTPIYCADTQGSKSARSKTENVVRKAINDVREKVKEGADEHLDKLIKKDDPYASLKKNSAVEGKLDESVRIGKAAGRFAARMSVLDVPNVKGKEAEAWADERLVDLLPLAVAEKEFELKFGDDEQRSKAADRILEANGRGKRENQVASAPTILLIGNGPQGQLDAPWIKRLPAKQIPEGVTVDEKK